MTKGHISSPKGTKNFRKGWDSIFILDGHKKTFAQMEPAEKHSLSQRKKAIVLFERFLEKGYG